ncbi:MAG: hypothetical protein CL764_06835 [Chloroflexi bacterium]|nr:hypothetical protein [Chloroflexota bacterium]
MSSIMKGIFAIPVTPFNEDGSLDIRSLEKCVDFCLEKGAHGIVMPVNASEVSTLTHEEWMTVLKTGLSRVNNSVPFVAGISGNSLEICVERAKICQDLGANSIMTMPPGKGGGVVNIREFYEQVSKAVELPIWIQNNKPPNGATVPTDLIIELLDTIPNIKFLKEESEYPGHIMSQVIRHSGSNCESVMGGMGGRFLLDEYRRGATGTMPAGHFTDLQVKLWNALILGKENDDGTREITKESRRLWEVLLPSLNFEFMFGTTAYKLVFWKRGVISSPLARIPIRKPFDDQDMIELDQILDVMENELTT